MPSSPAPPHREDAVPRRPGAARARLDDLAEVAAARTGVSPRALLGLLLVLGVLLAVLGARTALAVHRAAPEPVPGLGAPPADAGSKAGAVPVPPSSAASAAVAVPGSAGATTGATAGARVEVHVVGQVRHPGVVVLPAGARVQQALQAAGGPLRTADLAAVNLARFVVDGEQVVVPRPGQVAAPAGGPVAAPGPSGGPAAPVDLNAASAAELDALPGVGPVLAQRILDWRSRHGRFTSVDELGEVSGIGDAVLGRLRPLVRV